MKAVIVLIFVLVLGVFVLAVLGPYVGTGISIVSSCLISAGLSLGLGFMFNGLRRGTWR